MPSNEQHISRKEIIDWVLRGVLALLVIVSGIIAYQGKAVLSEIKDHDKRIDNNTISITRLSQSETDTQRRLERIELKVDELLKYSMNRDE